MVKTLVRKHCEISWIEICNNSGNPFDPNNNKSSFAPFYTRVATKIAVNKFYLTSL